MNRISLALALRSVLTAFFIACCGVGASTSIPGYPEEGHWFRGPTTTMEHWGSGSESLLLYGDGTALVVADVSNPTVMTVLGDVNTDSVVENIDIADDGQMAAVTDQLKWVTLVDISDRGAPSIVGRFAIESGRKPYGAAFGAGHLYVAIGPAGLWVFDIADPAHSVLVGTYVEPGTDFVFDVEVLGSHAFLADDDDGVTAIDISVPSNPTFAGRFAGANDASHIAIDGTTAYVSRRGYGFSILDLSAAPAMTELGAFTNAGGGIIYRTEVVDEGWVVCADGINGLLVVDVNNPASPVLETTFPQSMFTVATDGTTAFSTRVSYISNPTLFALDIDTSAPFDPPSHIGSLPLVGDSVGVAVDGHTVMIANETGGAFLVDASNPNDLQTIAEIDLGTRSIQTLALVGSTLAYGSFGSDLGLVDLTDMNAPLQLPDYSVPGGGYARDVIEIPGTQAVAVGAGPAGLSIVDLGNPLAPVEIGSWTPSSGYFLHVDLDANRVAGAGDGNVWVVDVSTISSPVDYASFTVSGTVQDVAISGDHVYVATNSGGVRIFDVSNPVTPTEVAVFLTSPTAARGVHVHGDRLYVAADTFWGLMVVDVSNPVAPALLQVIDTPGQALKVVVTDEIVALADGVAGVHVWGEVAPAEIPLFADGFESGGTGAWN